MTSKDQFWLDKRGDVYFTLANAQMHGSPPFSAMLPSTPARLAADQLLIDLEEVLAGVAGPMSVFVERVQRARATIAQVKGEI